MNQSPIVFLLSQFSSLRLMSSRKLSCKCRIFGIYRNFIVFILEEKRNRCLAHLKEDVIDENVVYDV